MSIPSQIAKHLREVYFGGNWTAVNFKDNLADVTWQQATTQVHNFNTITTLVFHTHYYVRAAIRVLQGEALNSKDEYSFMLPPIQSPQDWDKLLETSYADVEILASLIEQVPEQKFWENFTDKKYGNYYRNIHGIIEHLHYHLGQIVLIKKILLQTDRE